jgi:DNA-binding MarR family transcriptional regulator
MTRVISALVDSQLVRREPHESDRRQVVLTVTGGGTRGWRCG